MVWKFLKTGVPSGIPSIYVNCGKGCEGHYSGLSRGHVEKHPGLRLSASDGGFEVEDVKLRLWDSGLGLSVI